MEKKYILHMNVTIHVQNILHMNVTIVPHNKTALIYVFVV